MLVPDMDDTLLTDDHTISPRTEKWLRAQDLGVEVVLASDLRCQRDAICSWVAKFHDFFLMEQ
jgi:hypothetical protein